ncbi:MAG: hypothetical protein KDA84_20795, partial [Planctomycetaceae bacterium]|nr:hypothetical protein [Planctomycetaceae bacterium]
GPFPRVDGYNLTYKKTGSTLAVVSKDEYKAPWAAFWYRGLGRSAVLTMEVAGTYTGEFGRWDFYDDFLINHARWLLGGTRMGDVYIDLEREGQDAVVTVELDPQRQSGLAKQPPKLFVVPPGDERQKVLLPDFQWVGPFTLQARFRMDQTGTYRTLVQTENGQLTRGPAVTLPYSPEFAPQLDSDTGGMILAQLAELSGGKSRVDVVSIFEDPPNSARMMPLLPYLVMAAIALLVVEIAGRRLSLWKRSMASAPDATTERSLDPELGYRERWLTRRRKKASQANVALANSPEKQKAETTVDHIYARAKQRARSRTQND